MRRGTLLWALCATGCATSAQRTPPYEEGAGYGYCSSLTTSARRAWTAETATAWGTAVVSVGAILAGGLAGTNAQGTSIVQRQPGAALSAAGVLLLPLAHVLFSKADEAARVASRANFAIGADSDRSAYVQCVAARSEWMGGVMPMPLVPAPATSSGEGASFAREAAGERIAVERQTAVLVELEHQLEEARRALADKDQARAAVEKQVATGHASASSLDQLRAACDDLGQEIDGLRTKQAKARSALDTARAKAHELAATADAEAQRTRAESTAADQAASKAPGLVPASP